MKAVFEWQNETLGKKVVEALKANNFTAEYLANREEARKRVLELIPANSSVGFGGSVTVGALDLQKELAERGCTILDHGLPNLTAEEKIAIRKKQLTADVFLTGTNAVTLEGQLVNMDGTGNRVAAMIFGPQKVIVVAGVNKIVLDLEAAQERIEMKAAPLNNKRLSRPNPCVESGICMDCAGKTRICNILTVLYKKPTATDLIVLVVGEELGF